MNPGQEASGGAGSDRAGLRIVGTFLLGRDEYGIDMADLREVVDAPEALQVMPLAPAYLKGLFHLRGRVIPVLEPRMLLRMEEAGSAGERRRMAVVHRGAARLGLLFDAVGEVLRLSPGEVNAVSYSGAVGGIPVKAVVCREGGKRIIQVLDLEALFSIENLPAIEAMGGQDEAESRLTHRISDLYREKLIGFRVGECAMALEMQCVASIVEGGLKRPSPRKSELCESIVTLQGRVIPVVKVSRLLRLEGGAEASRILVCRVEGRMVGFEVDEVTSIIPYSKDKVLAIPVLHEYKAGVFRGSFTDREGKAFIVLDEMGLLSRPEIQEISLGHESLDLSREAKAEEEKKRAARVPVLAFRLGKLYGLKLADVLEVLEWKQELARTPSTPAAVLGVLHVRGNPVPVVDPRELFRLGGSAEGVSPKILVFQHEGSRVAMRVDSVETILQVSLGGEQDLPELFFRDEKGRFDEGYEKGIEARSKEGEKQAVVILRAEQIVERLAGALAA